MVLNVNSASSHSQFPTLAGHLASHTRFTLSMTKRRHFVARPYSETIYLPGHITTILVETASGIVEVLVDHIQFAPSSGPDSLTSKINSLRISSSGKALDSVVDVLPPKDIWLPGGVTTRISATISKPEIGLWPRISVNSKFDHDALELVDAEAAVGSADQNGITYSIKWKTMVDVPTVFKVITTTWNGELGPEAVTSRVIQPYIVHFVIGRLIRRVSMVGRRRSDLV
ncbi:hypothetical protein V8F06_007837 [Rhypophila decipiens]